MSFEKFCTPEQPGFWGLGQQKEKCSIKEKAQIEHTYKAIEIVSESQNKDINEQFTQFYKECVYLRAIGFWAAQSAVEEIKEVEKAEETDEEDEEFDNAVAPNLKKLRFIEIMTSDYRQITKEMKEEAFKLFPEVVYEIGNIGESISCDFKELIS